MNTSRASEDEEPAVEFGTRIENSSVSHLVQAGTVGHLHVSGEPRKRRTNPPEGGYRFDYTGAAAPPDLVELRLWLDRLADERRARVITPRAFESRGTWESVHQFASSIDKPIGYALPSLEMQRLVVLGVSSYLAGSAPSPPDRLPEQVLLDLVVFGMWPVATAERLPDDWEEPLSRLSSPRIAALVATARAEQSGRREESAVRFARAVAAQDFATPLLMLCESLSDPQGAGADLASLAAAAGLDPARSRRPKQILKWLLRAAIGGTATGSALQYREEIESLVEDLADGMPEPETRNTRAPVSDIGDHGGADSGYGDGGGDSGGGGD